jgi:hypothetical protein
MIHGLFLLGSMHLTIEEKPNTIGRIFATKQTNEFVAAN